MSDQLSMAGFEPINEKETAFFEKVLPSLRTAAVDIGINPDDIRMETRRDYSFVHWRGLLAFRLRIRKKTNYISVPLASKEAVENLAPEDQQLKSGQDFWRVNLEGISAESCSAALSEVLRYTINRQPKEWDCCSRYLECSNAKKCVHPDEGFSLGCGYRKILASGKIYYGANRNVE